MDRQRKDETNRSCPSPLLHSRVSSVWFLQALRRALILSAGLALETNVYSNKLISGRETDKVGIGRPTLTNSTDAGWTVRMASVRPWRKALVMAGSYVLSIRPEEGFPRIWSGIDSAGQSRRGVAP